MRSFALLALLSFSAQVHAEEPAVTDELVDMLVEKLSNKLFGLSTKQIPAQRMAPAMQALSPLTTLGKPGLQSPLSTKQIPDQRMSHVAHGMKAYSPFNGKKYETLSYLPQLSNQEIEKQIRYIINNHWTPGLEFSDDGDVYLNTRMGPGYYDNRYWALYKLPMFGCTDPSEVIREIEACKSEFPNAVIRVVGFDSIKQVQTTGFIVRK